MSVLRQCFLREVVLQVREVRRLLNAGLFFLMVLAIFPLGFEANQSALKQLLPGLVWIAALFAFLLSAEGIFHVESEAGVLEQWMLSDVPMHTRIRIKLLVHWLSILLPLMLLSLLVAVLFDLSLSLWGVLAVSLAFGTPILYVLAAFSAAFGLSLKHQGLLTALIVLPLCLPVMVFGGGVLTKAMQGLPVSGDFAFLLAIAILAVWGVPYAVAAVIRVGVADVGR